MGLYAMPSNIVWDDEKPSGIVWDDAPPSPAKTAPPSLWQMVRPEFLNSDIQTGTKSGLHRAAAGLTDTAAWLGGDYVGRPLRAAMQKYGLSPSPEMLARDKAAVAAGSGMADIAQAGAEGVVSLLPMSQLSKARAAMSAGAGTAAKIVGDLGLNAGISAAMAPEDEKATSAALGAGGAAVGNVATRVLSGPLANLVTPEAKRMMEKGIGMTPGQMISGEGSSTLGRLARGFEDRAAAMPFIGDALKFRTTTGMAEWGKSALNDLVRPLGKAVQSVGSAGVRETKEALRDAFKSSREYVQLKPEVAKTAVDNILEGVNNIPMIGANQVKDFEKYVSVHVLPHFDGTLGGDEIKVLHDSITKEARKWSKQPQLRDAFQQLKLGIMDAIEGKSSLAAGSADEMAAVAKEAADEVSQFRKTLVARDKFEVFKEASKRAKDTIFTPSQVQTAADKLKQHIPSGTQDARHVFPNALPPTGTASQMAMNELFTPAGQSGTAASGGLEQMLRLGTAGLLTGGMTSKPGTKYLAEGVSPIINALRSGKKLTPQELEAIIRPTLQQGGRLGAIQLGEQDAP